MVNTEILEGLRHALERGNSLENAMLSFWNSGYKKEEIEEAARALVSHPSQMMSHPDKEIPIDFKQPMQKLPPRKRLPTPADLVHLQSAAMPAPAKTYQSAMPNKAMPMPMPMQKPALVQQGAKPVSVQANPQEKKQLVSKYEEKKKKGGKLTIIFLIIVLLVFLGMLAGIIIFKNELIQFFNTIFA